MGNELISVIIACYNAESFIDECLGSIVNQGYTNIEIIICDDASTDSSFSLLKKWQERDPRIKLIRNSHNLFAASTRNNCINVANGKYLLIQDIDDVSMPNRIYRLLSSLEKNKVDFVSSSMSIIDDSGIINHSKMISHRQNPTKYDFLWGISFNHPATLFTTECIKNINGYSVTKDTRRNEDYDLFMRLYNNGAKGMNVHESLYLYRVNIENLKRRTLRSRWEECRIRYKGFKQLNILIVGLPFFIKPLIVHLIRRSFRL